jgi:hypothetical protein
MIARYHGRICGASAHSSQVDGDTCYPSYGIDASLGVLRCRELTSQSWPRFSELA